MILVKPSHKIITEIDYQKILNNLESAGRTCYKSNHKTKKGSAEKLIRNIIKRGHLSVIEHENISVRLICDRGISHELVRHRIVSYSQESTRYCNYHDGITFIIPPWVEIREGKFAQEAQGATYKTGTWLSAMMHSEATYLNLLKQGYSPQQARTVLPNSLKTELVMTANLREWIHIFKLRCNKASHPQMIELMTPLRDELIEQLPVIFE